MDVQYFSQLKTEELGETNNVNYHFRKKKTHKSFATNRFIQRKNLHKLK